MVGHSSACRGGFRQDQRARDDVRAPAQQRTRDRRGNPHLHVEPAEGLLDGGELRLHLDDQDNAGRLVPRKKVKRPPVAGLGERHLGTHPPARGGEHTRDVLDEFGMTLVDQPVERAAAPEEIQRRPLVYGAADPAHDGDADVVEAASLDVRDLLLPNAGVQRQIALTPPESPPESTDSETETPIVHGDRMPRATYQRRICRCAITLRRNRRNYAQR